MSVNEFRIKLSIPDYFYRNYSNDLNLDQLVDLVPKEQEEQVENYISLKNAKRIVNTALPFIGLIKPLSQPLSILFGIRRTITCLVDLQKAYTENSDKLEMQKHLPKLLSVATSCASVALAIIAPAVAVLVVTAQDLVSEIGNLEKNLTDGKYKEAIESAVHIANSSLYLSLILIGGSQLTIASLGLQVLIGAYRCQSEFKKGNYIEASGHVAMTLFRCNELKNQVSILQATKLERRERAETRRKERLETLRKHRAEVKEIQQQLNDIKLKIDKSENQQKETLENILIKLESHNDDINGLKDDIVDIRDDVVDIRDDIYDIKDKLDDYEDCIDCLESDISSLSETQEEQFSFLTKKFNKLQKQLLQEKVVEKSNYSMLDDLDDLESSINDMEAELDEVITVLGEAKIFDTEQQEIIKSLEVDLRCIQNQVYHILKEALLKKTNLNA